MSTYSGQGKHGLDAGLIGGNEGIVLTTNYFNLTAPTGFHIAFYVKEHGEHV